MYLFRVRGVSLVASWRWRWIKT